METPLDLTPLAEVLLKGDPRVQHVPQNRLRTLRAELHEAGYALVPQPQYGVGAYAASKYSPVRPAPQSRIYAQTEERSLWMMAWAAAYAGAPLDKSGNVDMTPSSAAFRADLAVTELRFLRAQGG